MTAAHIDRNRSLAFALLLMSFANARVLAAEVDVYGLGIYDANQVIVDIWIDANTAVVSGGVRLTYDPLQLTLTNASKNATDWYFGDGTTNYPYPNPDLGTPGQVVILVAKVDTNNPTAGITGPGILVGTVEFIRSSTISPIPDPVDSFGLELSLGREGPYENFVTPNGSSLDSSGVAFSGITMDAGDSDADGMTDDMDNCTLVPNGPLLPDEGGQVQLDSDGDGYGNGCDGDLNNDGVVDSLDVVDFRQKLFRDFPEADFNGDLVVGSADMAIFREMLFKPPGPSGLAP